MTKPKAAESSHFETGEKVDDKLVTFEIVTAIKVTTKTKSERSTKSIKKSIRESNGRQK